MCGRIFLLIVCYVVVVLLFISMDSSICCLCCAHYIVAVCVDRFDISRLMFKCEHAVHLARYRICLMQCAADGMLRYRYQLKMKCFTLYKLFSLWPPKIGIELKRISYIDWIAVAQTHASQCFVTFFLIARWCILCIQIDTTHSQTLVHAHTICKTPNNASMTVNNIRKKNDSQYDFLPACI